MPAADMPQEVSSRRTQVARDVASRTIMVLAALGAVMAFVGGLAAAQDAGDSTRWLESWRAVGFVTFAALFALLALRPRGVPGVWEIVFANKAALGVIALLDTTADGRSAGLIDAILAVLIAVAYVLARGWTAWSSTATRRASSRKLPVPEPRAAEQQDAVPASGPVDELRP